MAALSSTTETPSPVFPFFQQTKNAYVAADVDEMRKDAAPKIDIDSVVLDVPVDSIWQEETDYFPLREMPSAAFPVTVFPWISASTVPSDSRMPKLSTVMVGSLSGFEPDGLNGQVRTGSGGVVPSKRPSIILPEMEPLIFLPRPVSLLTSIPLFAFRDTALAEIAPLKFELPTRMPFSVFSATVFPEMLPSGTVESRTLIPFKLFLTTLFLMLP